MSVDFYSQPSFASGRPYRIYNSSRPQNGSGILSSIASFLAPIGKMAIRGLTGNIGRKVASKGAEVLTGVAVDALRGQHVGESLKRRARNAALDALTAPVRKLKQKGVKRSKSKIGKASKRRRANLF